MKDESGRNISVSTVAAGIMVYGIQRLGTIEDNDRAWRNLSRLLGLERASSMFVAIGLEMFDLANECDPDVNPDGFMELAKGAIRDHVRAQY